MKPLFSVIIPLYNKQNFIESTLNSVINQDFKDFEIIVINDGSTDNSLGIVSSLSDKRIKIINQENSGVSAARNKGIELAKADYIALLDADDIWYTNHLQELKKLIETFPEAGLFCANHEVSYNKGLCLPAKFNFEYDIKPVIIKDYFKASIINSVAWTSAVSFSKKNFNEIGGFDTSLRTAQDLDLWIRFALKHQVAFNPKITITYNIQVEKSLSKNEYNEIRCQFINKFKEEEQKNNSLKLYLDINRYAVALRSKINNDFKIYKKLKSDINFKNLNFKQQFLLSAPRFVIILFKKFQEILKKKNIYFTAFD